MTVDDKLAVQAELVAALTANQQQHPTLLLDTLLAGDGVNLVQRILASLEITARQRAERLGGLLRLVRAELQPPSEPPIWPPQTQGDRE